MKTASFFTYTGPGRISIARFPARGTPPGFRVYKLLAPQRRDMLHMEYEPYRALFMAHLDTLDAQATWGRLHELSGDHEPVLLCYENLNRPGEWCHRTLVAEWFKRELGHEVTKWPN